MPDDNNDNQEIKETNPIEEARKKFQYAQQMASAANTVEALDFWNAEIDRAKAELDRVIREDKEKTIGLKIRTFGGYDKFDIEADKKAKEDSGSTVSDDSSDNHDYNAQKSDAPIILYSPKTTFAAPTATIEDKKHHKPKAEPSPLPRVEPINETTKNASGSNGDDDIRKKIIKVALALLGHTTPDDLNIDKNPLYKKVSELYECTKIDLLSRYDWKFAIVKAGLHNLGKCQENRYIYELPCDLLKIQQLIPNCNYSREGCNIYSYTDNLALLYVSNVKDDSLPEFFKILLIYSLAAISAALVTQNETIARKWELEANQRFCIAVANDTAEQATHGVSRNSIYTSHFY